MKMITLWDSIIFFELIIMDALQTTSTVKKKLQSIIALYYTADMAGGMPSLSEIPGFKFRIWWLALHKHLLKAFSFQRSDN